MKTITSKEALLKKLKKENILTDGHIFYLTDFHRTKVGRVLVEKMISERVVEPANQMKKWFEKEWKLREPVGEYLGVKIFKDHIRNQFFFRVKKGTYDIDTYQICIEKLQYLKRLGEKLV